MPEETKVFETDYVVTEREAIHFMGAEVPPVLSTPSMINWMELASRANASELLKPGEDTVGVSVQVTHLAATPVGMKVHVVSKLKQVEGRTYSFEVEAFDEKEKIGEGLHKRSSVTLTKFADRILAKKETSKHAG
ncbi:MAG: thioesterase family protein [Terriglobales bacterium]